MAYSTNNRPYLIVAPLGGGFGNFSTNVSGQVAGGSSDVGGALWVYRSTDPIAAVQVANYFSDGFKMGMKKGDIMFAITLSTLSTISTGGIGVVTAVNASSAATLGFLFSSST